MPKLFNVFSAKKESNHLGATELVRLVRNESEKMQLATFNYAWLKPTEAFEKHSHPDCVEYFLILSGTANFYLDNEVEKVTSGDFIRVEQDVVHSLKNTSKKKLEFISLRAING